MISTKNNNIAACLASLSLSVAAPAAQPATGADQGVNPHPKTNELLGRAAPRGEQTVAATAQVTTAVSPQVVLTPTERIANAVEKIGELKFQSQLYKNKMNDRMIEAQQREIGAAVAELVKPGIENHEANGAALRAAGLDSRGELYLRTAEVAGISINTIAKGIELNLKELQSPEGW